MLETLRKLREGVLDILLPKFCLGCGREGLYICKDCEVFLSEVDPIYLPRVNGSHPREAQNVISVWEYEGLMEKLIHEIKYRGKYHIIDELVEKALAKIELNLPEDAVITFVPMYKKRERERGFNQAELIARKLSGSVDHQVVHMLEKVKDNRSQVGLSPKEREENVRGAFIYCGPPGGPQAGNVLLVDDVYTTGATAKECVRVLKRAGVKNVWGFTLARKLRI